MCFDAGTKLFDSFAWTSHRGCTGPKSNCGHMSWGSQQGIYGPCLKLGACQMWSNPLGFDILIHLYLYTQCDREWCQLYRGRVPVYRRSWFDTGRNMANVKEPIKASGWCRRPVRLIRDEGVGTDHSSGYTGWPVGEGSEWREENVRLLTLLILLWRDDNACCSAGTPNSPASYNAS